MRLETRIPKSESAFTLIEIVISASLMAMILVSGYLCLQSAVATQRLVEPRTEIIQNARVAMATIAADLRAACPLSKDVDFLGMPRTIGAIEADNLDFATHNYTPRHGSEGDFCEVSYYLQTDPASGQCNLWRRRNPRIAVDPLDGGNREELARGLLGLRFQYYDGLDWYDTWGDVEGRGKAQSSLRVRSNLSGMPDAVQITLWFDSNPRSRKPETGQTMERTNMEPPLVFQTIARLNLAANAQRSAGSGTPADDSSDTTGQPAGNAGANQ